MATAATRINIGSPATLTISSSVTSLAYSTGQRLQNTEGAPLADFTVTGVTFGAAPVAGALRIAIVSRDSAGNAGPMPSAALVPNITVGLGPQPSTGNTSTGWLMTAERVPIPPDCDFYVYNASTGQSLNAATVTAQRYGYGM